VVDGKVRREEKELRIRCKYVFETYIYRISGWTQGGFRDFECRSCLSEIIFQGPRGSRILMQSK
jgi:hypothetical protein